MADARTEPKMDDRLIPAARSLVDAARQEEYLTVAEFAELRKVHPQTVRLWIKLGVVKAERTREPKGHWRIPRRPSAA